MTKHSEITQDVRDRLADRLYTVGLRLAQSEDPDAFRTPDGQNDVKRLIACAWGMLHPKGRQQFLDALDGQLRFQPVTKASEKERHEAQIVEILSKWPKVLGSVSGPDRGFAMSIMKSRNNASWWPTDAQIARLKSIWAERDISDADDFEVTE